MCETPTKQELLSRIEKFINSLNTAGKPWDSALIIDKLNQYYFTGTMQDGLLVIKNDGSYVYFVRRSFDRAKMESPLENIFPISTYRDAAAKIGENLGAAYIESDIVTLSIMERLNKYFKIEQTLPADRLMFLLRAVKTPYELYWMEESGRQHQYLLETVVPQVLRLGISEAEFMAELYKEMISLGYQAISRFAMFQTNLVGGQIGFGVNSIYPLCFDGPGGMLGMSPAVPFFGNRERKLQRGDLVFVDIGYGVNGYHTDKTQIYMFDCIPSGEVLRTHRTCMEICQKIAAQLVPGKIPSDIYNEVSSSIEPEFLPNFMGFGNKTANFLGHGVGLVVDEHPVIANGYNIPLEENMVVAVEPKKGIENVGLVGVEETFVVTKNGGKCITGGARDIILL